MADFIYCLNSSTIRPTPILDKIRIAGETGYKAIELWHDDIDSHLQKGGTLAELRWALADHGLTVPTTIYLKGWFETTGPEHVRELEECKRRMNQAAELGGLVHPPLAFLQLADVLGPGRLEPPLEVDGCGHGQSVIGQGPTQLGQRAPFLQM